MHASRPQMHILKNWFHIQIALATGFHMIPRSVSELKSVMIYNESPKNSEIPYNSSDFGFYDFLVFI